MHFFPLKFCFNVNVDTHNLGFPYFNFLGGYQLKKSPCIYINISEIAWAYCEIVSASVNDKCLHLFKMIPQMVDDAHKYQQVKYGFLGHRPHLSICLWEDALGGTSWSYFGKTMKSTLYAFPNDLCPCFNIFL